MNQTRPIIYPLSGGERQKLVGELIRSELTLKISRIHFLHWLMQTQTRLTASDLSHQVNMPLSTACRNLSAFADFGLVDFILDRSDVCRWFFLIAGSSNYCPACNQVFNAAYLYQKNSATSANS
ncbi:helix-turn-helix domain-containing protein [uncultured Pantoea sp.]|uniref:helix-turn-helix domain-containing protein n=1 Tax=uncultured Pantoea sp. TaxID=218084 RepID=UPI00338F74C9